MTGRSLLDGSVWSMDRSEHRIKEFQSSGKVVEHGFGVIATKAKLGKSKGQESVRLDISIAPFIENDSETIPFSSKTDAAGNSVNDQNITGFLNKWIRDPRKISNRQTGCEINFNRYFSSKSSVRASSEIWIELEQVDEELSKIEEEISRHTVWRKK